MPDQGSLFAELDRPATIHKVLIAVYPPPEVRSHIWSFAKDQKDNHGLRGRQRPENLLHNTVHHLLTSTHVPETMIEAACSAMAAVAQRISSFEVTYDAVMTFKNSQAFVLCGDDGKLSGLYDLYSATTDALVQAGVKPIMTPFKPHISLLYDPKIINPHAVEPIRWTVRDFALVVSPQGQTRHDQRGRWTLKG